MATLQHRTDLFLDGCSIPAVAGFVVRSQGDQVGSGTILGMESTRGKTGESLHKHMHRATLLASDKDFVQSNTHVERCSG